MHRCCALLHLLTLSAFGNTIVSRRCTPPALLWTATASSIGAITATDRRRDAPLDLLVRKFDADMMAGSAARPDLTTSVFDRAGSVALQDAAVDSVTDMKFPRVSSPRSVIFRRWLKRCWIGRLIRRWTTQISGWPWVTLTDSPRTRRHGGSQPVSMAVVRVGPSEALI